MVLNDGLNVYLRWRRQERHTDFNDHLKNKEGGSLTLIWLVGNRSGHEGDHSFPSSAEAKNGWSCTSTAPYIFMA
jgi:hypothetical protein